MALKNDGFCRAALKYLGCTELASLSVEEQRTRAYILSVAAYDCGMRRSEPLLVRVEVKQACNTGWTGKSLTYRQKVYRVRQFRIEQNAEVVVCS